jgi:hypothetical protein
MATKHSGEATFTVDDKTFTLRIDLRAWALAQDELTKGARVPSLELIGKRLESDHALTIMAVFWAALQRHHPLITADQAYDILEQSGGAGTKALIEAVNLANPDTADAQELRGAANPPEAQAKEDKPRGAGGKSTSKHAA